MIEIPLRNSDRIALVDERDELRVMNAGPWSLMSVRTGHRTHDYAAKRIMTRTVLMHRFIMRSVPESADRFIDHANGNGLDNRRSNLRVATHAENSQNRCSDRNATSRFLGVSWDAEREKWAARIRGRWIGRFESEFDAAIAYDVEAIKEYGEFARLNWPTSRSA